MTGRSAIVITVANIAAGALNYLYQIHAVAVLDEAAFGTLSAWLARVGIVSAVGTVVQFVSLDAKVPERPFQLALRISGLVCLLLVILHLAFRNVLGTTELAVSAVIANILIYAVLGQLQARLRLGIVAAAALLVPIARFTIPFAWARAVRAPGFYVAHATSFYMGVVAAAALVAFVPAPAPSATASTASAQPERLRLARPVLLAFATVLFPLIDVLVVSSTHDAATTGAFSRIQLASRVVFFAGAAAVSILLPHQLHAAKHGTSLPPVPALLERFLTLGALASALGLAFVVDVLLLHPPNAERIWLYATCLNAALLVGILGQVNLLAVRERLGQAALFVAAVIVTSATAAGLSLLSAAHPVTWYVLGALVADIVVLLAARTAARRLMDAPDQV